MSLLRRMRGRPTEPAVGEPGDDVRVVVGVGLHDDADDGAGQPATSTPTSTASSSSTTTTTTAATSSVAGTPAGGDAATGRDRPIGAGPTPELDASRWADLARRVLLAEGVTGPAELGLTFVDEPAMADLNHTWMGEDGATDVLSFPIDSAGPTGTAEPARGPVPVGATATRLLGDVVVCPSVADGDAVASGRSFDDEMALLVVHGVLHVLGHDHAVAAEEAAMQAREDAHLTRLHDPRWTRSPS